MTAPDSPPAAAGTPRHGALPGVGGRVSIRALAARQGAATHGTWLVLLAVPCVLPLPGVGIVFGLGLIALAAQMLAGVDRPRLPARVDALTLPRRSAARVRRLLTAVNAFAARWLRPRFTALTGSGYRRWPALAAAVMAILIVLPIPFGNTLPALAVTALGLGLAQRDGLVVIAGLGFSLVAFAVDAAIVLGAWALGGAGLMRLTGA